MEPLLIALIVVLLIAGLVFSRVAPALLFTLAAAACVLAGSIDMQMVLAKATNDGLVTLLLLVMVLYTLVATAAWVERALKMVACMLWIRKPVKSST